MSEPFGFAPLVPRDRQGRRSEPRDPHDTRFALTRRPRELISISVGIPLSALRASLGMTNSALVRYMMQSLGRRAQASQDDGTRREDKWTSTSASRDGERTLVESK